MMKIRDKRLREEEEKSERRKTRRKKERWLCDVKGEEDTKKVKELKMPRGKQVNKVFGLNVHSWLEIKENDPTWLS